MCNNFDSELKHDRQTDIHTDRQNAHGYAICNASQGNNGNITSVGRKSTQR